MGLLGTMQVRFGADISGLTSGIAQAKNNLSGFSGAVAGPLGAVASVAAAAGGALIGFGALSVKSAADFQQSMLKVQAYAGLSKQQMDSMSNSILDMATKVGQSPKALADAIYPIISSGYGAADALNILKLSAETAAASGAQTSVVADALTTSLGAMHAPASDAGHYMDMFNKIVSLGKGEVPQYASVIGKLSLAASGAHVDFGTMGAALADLTTHGFPSVAQASTSLGNLFTQIGVKTDALAQHAQKAGIAFDAHKFATLDLAGKLDYLQKITGGNQGELLKLVGGSTLALKAFNALEGGTKDLHANLDAMQNSAGATDSAFKTASSGLNATMARAQASVETLQVKIGTALLPAITSLVDKVAPAVSKFLDWAEKNHIVENAVSALTTAVTDTSNAISTLVSWGAQVTNFFKNNQIAMDGLKAVMIGVGAGLLAFAIYSIPAVIAGLAAMAVSAWAAAAPVLAMAAPFVAIGLIVAAVVFGIILAVQHWGEITKFLQGVWGAFSSWFMSALGAIGNFFHTIWDGIVFGLKVAWDAIVNVVKIGAAFLLAVILGPFIAIGAAFIWLYNHNYYFKALVDAIVNFFKGCFAWLQGAWTDVINWLVGLWNGLVGFASALWAKISNTIRAGFFAAIAYVQAIWGQISSFFTNAWNTYIVKPLTAVWTNVSNFFSNIWTNYIAGPIGSLWNSISSTIGGWAGKAVQWGKNLIQGFIDGITGMLGSVGDAAGKIAGKVAQFLGFHSPAKEGPGSEADIWAPNFVNMYAKGLEAGIPKIQSAMQKLAAPTMANLKIGSASYPAGSSNNSAAILAAVASSASSNSNNNQSAHFHIYIDGKEVTSKLGPHIANAIRASGVRNR